MTQRDWKLSFKKGKNAFFAGTISRKQRSRKIVPKTPSGLHFELTDQKLSANCNSTLPNSSCCFHRSSDQSHHSPFPPVPPPPFFPCYYSLDKCWELTVLHIDAPSHHASNALAQQLIHLYIIAANGLY